MQRLVHVAFKRCKRCITDPLFFECPNQSNAANNVSRTSLSSVESLPVQQDRRYSSSRSSILSRKLRDVGCGSAQSLPLWEAASDGCHRARGFKSSAAPLSKDYYELLGVSKTATENEIKKAYYNLAKKHHPDANKDDAASAKIFQDVSTAYEVLRDPQKRSVYDRVGTSAFEGGADWGGQGGQQQGGRNPFRSGASPFGDIFDQFFSGGRTGQQQGGGFYGFASVQTQVSVEMDFMEAIHGKTQDVKLGFGGMGNDPGPIKTINVVLPAGVENGQQLIINEAAHHDGMTISLVVLCKVGRHPVFTRKGADVIATKQIRLSSLLMGSDEEVTTVWGRKKIRVPAGSKPGDEIRIPGEGAPIVQGHGRGRHIVKIAVDVPRKLSSEQLAALEHLRATGL